MSLPNVVAYKAGGTIHVGHAVKISADNTVVECSAAADKAVGIAQRQMRDTPGLTGADNTIAASTGQSVMVYGPGTLAPGLSGAAVTVGGHVSSDGAGLIIDAVATSNILGIAVEGAAGANLEIQILVWPMGIF